MRKSVHTKQSNRRITLSGWTRLWIVASVVWLAAGAVIVLPGWPARPAQMQLLLEICERPDAKASDQMRPLCAGYAAADEEVSRQQWASFTLPLALWLGGPLLFIGAAAGAGWIRRGFNDGGPRTPPRSGSGNLNF